MKFDKATKETYIDMGYEEEEVVASSYIQMHFIELPKFIKKNPEVKTRLEQWLWLLAGKEDKIEMAEKKNKEVKKAVEVLNEMSMDPKERERCESIALAEFFRRDAERIKMEKQMKAVASKLLEKGMEIEEIVDITKLTKEDIEELKKETKGTGIT